MAVSREGGGTSLAIVSHESDPNINGFDETAPTRSVTATGRSGAALAPPSPARELITGVVCGVRVEEVEEPTMRQIRYLDKSIDELARGKAMEKILRSA